MINLVWQETDIWSLTVVLDEIFRALGVNANISVEDEENRRIKVYIKVGDKDFEKVYRINDMTYRMMLELAYRILDEIKEFYLDLGNESRFGAWAFVKNGNLYVYSTTEENAIKYYRCEPKEVLWFGAVGVYVFEPPKDDNAYIIAKGDRMFPMRYTYDKNTKRWIEEIL